MFAKVVINSRTKKLNRTFDYKVPKHLEEKVYIGSRVLVSFGNNKNKKQVTDDAYIISFSKTSEFECKEIIDIVKSEELTEEKLKLAKIMSKRYFCHISDCIKLLMNPEIGSKNINNIMEDKEIKYISINDELSKKLKDKLQNKELDIIKFLNEYEEEKKEINKKFKITNSQYLILEELIKNIININININENLNVNNLNNKNEIAEIKYLEFVKELKEKEIGTSAINTLIKNELVVIKTKLATFDDYDFQKLDEKRDEELKLNDEQQIVYDNIKLDIIDNVFSENLIYGVTGSGKTEVYMHLIKKVLEEGKNAIVLVPEIGLTPQMMSRFISRFGKGKISILHSKLSSRRRYEEWKRIKEGLVNIVIGVRSAIFAPLDNIGLIIVDEEHDQSYISDTIPKYDAKEIARYIAKQQNSPIIYGTATPLIQTYYRANSGQIKLYKLENRVNNIKMPDIEIVDLRYERDILSKKLIEEIKNNIAKNKQSILFLNKRGHSSMLTCKSCGHTEKCFRCNVSMKYHKRDNLLKCHYCNFTKAVTNTCFKCKNPLSMFGIGTEQLEEKLKEKIPNISTIRMDLDTTTKQMSHEEIINKFKNENINVLIGTQMITKGHHFENVELAAVILADSLINQDTYRSSEVAFNTIIQVTGRAGREGNGKAIIQTYNPEDHVIQLSKNNDYEKFYKLEIGIRKMLNYPPFMDILQFRVTSKNSFNAQIAAKNLRVNLEKMKIDVIKKETEKKEELLKNLEIFKESYENSGNFQNILESDKINKEIEKINSNILNLKNMEILNEAPFRIDKIENTYRYKVIVKCNLTNYLAKLFNYVVDNFNKNDNILVTVDLNPYEV